MKTATTLPLIVLLLGCLFRGYGQDGNASGSKPPAGVLLNIRFCPLANGSPLLFDREYRNQSGELYSVTAFKFYISHITLVNTDTRQVYAPGKENYFLLDASDTASLFISLPAKPFRFNAISFLIGVDSLRNLSGAQSGALDPALGMFWTWNSGYIMAKLEGHSPVSTLVNNKFEYHIGGFRGSNSVLKKAVIRLPGKQFAQVAANRSNQLTVTVNVDAWFDGPHRMTIATTPACTTPGPLANRFSENYAQMFMVTQTSN